MQIKSLQIGRGLAAMAVLAFHLSIMVTEPRFNLPPIFADYTSHGRLGVDFFFVLSGFIMPFAYAKDIGNPDRAGGYALKRFIRLYPLYWLLTVAILLGSGLTGGVNTPPREPADILSTLSLFHFTSYSPPLTVAWTLFHEVLFYSIFISLIFNKRFGVALLGAWLALILFNWTYIEHGHWSFWNTIISTHNLSFFLGIAAYWISSRASLKSRGLPLLVAGICLLLVACSLDPGVAEGTEIRFTYNIAFTLLICGAVLYEKNRPVTGLAILKLIGDASYLLYLAHESIVSTLLKLGAKAGILTAVAPEVLYIFIFVVTVTSSIVGYKLIEAPTLRFLRTRVRKWKDAIQSEAPRPKSSPHPHSICTTPTPNET